MAIVSSDDTPFFLSLAIPMGLLAARSFALACLTAIVATTEGRAQDSIPAAARDSVKEGLIRQLLTQTKAIALAITAMEANLPSQRAAMPQIPAVFWERFMVQIRERTSELEDMMVPVYGRHFTTQELRELLVFYDTPLGKRLLEAQPALVQEGALAGQEWGRRIGAAVAEQLAKEMIKDNR